MIGILAAAVVYWLLGAIWYSPALFAKPWTRLVGLKPDHMKAKSRGEMFAPFFGTFICALFVAYGVHCFLLEMVIIEWSDLLGLALTAAVAFVAATHLPSYLYVKKPLKLYLIDTGYHFFGVIICFVVIHALKRFV